VDIDDYVLIDVNFNTQTAFPPRAVTRRSYRSEHSMSDPSLSSSNNTLSSSGEAYANAFLAGCLNQPRSPL